MTTKRRHQLRAIAWLGLFTGALGAVFSYFTSTQALPALGQGFVDGLLIGTLIAGYLVMLVEDRWARFFKQLSFSVAVLVNALAFVGLFFAGRVLGQFLTQWDIATLRATFFASNLLPGLALGLVVAVLVSFVRQLNRLVGQNVLLSFITGRYHQPVMERRTFMFLDLEGSTRLAEQLGDAAFHRFLQNFFNDLTEAVLDTGGEIYKYVGDEVIISWPEATAQQRGLPVQCFVQFQARIHQQAGHYQRHFGAVPAFRAGVHSGSVVAGELGDLKQEISYLGDVLNTTARLLEQARATPYRLIISAAALGQAPILPPQATLVDLGTFQPRGKQAAVPVLAVRFDPAELGHEPTG